MATRAQKQTPAFATIAYLVVLLPRGHAGERKLSPARKKARTIKICVEPRQKVIVGARLSLPVNHAIEGEAPLLNPILPSSPYSVLLSCFRWGTLTNLSLSLSRPYNNADAIKGRPVENNSSLIGGLFEWWGRRGKRSPFSPPQQSVETCVVVGDSKDLSIAAGTAPRWRSH